ncbi:twin-arginine translocase subunit TatC [Nitratifractor sp.]
MKPHLVELRQRLAISVAAVFVGFVIAFTFHNAILSWITEPLNEALVKVGKIVEQRDKASWKIRSTEANASSAASGALASVLENRRRNTRALEANLSKAAALEHNRTLAAYLTGAAWAAGELARSERELATALTTEMNRTLESKTKELREKSFSGMITTHQVGGAFFVALKVSFFAGLLLALPVVLWQIWLFVAPGLYEHEKKMVLPFVVGGSIMFLIGVLFAYYVVTPFGFQFLITFGSFLYTPLINIEDYVGFFTKIMLGFGLAFELPVFAYFLGLLGLITDQTLIRFFKYAIVIIFLLAAILTPPDVLTQLLMAAPLILLYGLSILIVRFVNPEKSDEDEETEPEAEGPETATDPK